MSAFSRKAQVAAARGDREPDILITDVTLANELTGTLDGPVDIGIVENRIVFVIPKGTGAKGRVTIQGTGLFAVPAFIDGHVHNESSMVLPSQWAKHLLRHGTGTVFTDPHEMGNVMGLPGIRYMIEASRGLPLRYFITAPSCVPAVPHLETAGAVITDKEMREILGWERVMAVAEAMDYRGLIVQEGNITPIAEVAHEMEIGIEGHAPGVVGRDLQAYAAAIGPSGSDHEAMSTNEMVEKVHAGIMIYARSSTFHDGSIDVANALKQVRDNRMFGFCTDDIMPHHLLESGHLDHGLRRLIQAGVDPISAIQMATINVAQHYRLQGIGAIAPGWMADIVLLQNLESIDVLHVIINGQLVVQDKRLTVDINEPIPPLLDNSVHIPPLSEESFVPQGGEGVTTYNGIDMSDLFTEKTTIKAMGKGGKIIFPLPAGVTLAAIVPRHGQNRPPSLALMTGYPLRAGAIASTVSHDSHNLVIIGNSPGDMLAAALELQRIGGGLTAVNDGTVLASVELPIAGLMSPLTVEEVAGQIDRFEKVLPGLGLPAAFPVHLLALALPVVPKVRITDLKGLVDVATQQSIPMIA
jgi:adenine deaminase